MEFYPVSSSQGFSARYLHLNKLRKVILQEERIVFMCKTSRFQPGKPKRNHTIPFKLSQIPSLFSRWATASTGSFLLRQNLDFFTFQLSVHMEVFSARSLLFKQMFKMCNANSGASQTLCTCWTPQRLKLDLRQTNQVHLPVASPQQIKLILKYTLILLLKKPHRLLTLSQYVLQI